MPLLTGIAARLLHQRTTHLILRHVQLIGFANLADDQAEPHPALGDLAVLRAHLLLRAPLIRKGAFGSFPAARELPPNDVELAIDQRSRQHERVRFLALAPDLPMEPAAGP